jgi:hypothetical protein
VLPFQVTTIVDAPEGFEERLERLSLNLTSLTIFVPERHDLAMMKVARGYEHDLEALEDVHRLQPLGMDTLTSVEMELSSTQLVTSGGTTMRLMRRSYR